MQSGEDLVHYKGETYPRSLLSSVEELSIEYNDRSYLLLLPPHLDPHEASLQFKVGNYLLGRKTCPKGFLSRNVCSSFNPQLQIFIFLEVSVHEYDKEEISKQGCKLCPTGHSQIKKTLQKSLSH